MARLVSLSLQQHHHPGPGCLPRATPSPSPPPSFSSRAAATAEWRAAFGGQDRIGTDGTLVQEGTDGSTQRLTTAGGLVRRERERERE